jgi:hypothetical protein
MKVSQMMDSKFLKKEDVEPAILVTVRSFQQENMAQDGQMPQMKWCMAFEEDIKPLPMNSTNLQLCQMIFNSDDTDHWIGGKLVLYNDPSIQFNGKLTGGVRIRAPRLRPAAAPKIVAAPAPVAPGPTPFDDMSEDIPF